MLLYAYVSIASLDVEESQKQQYACAVNFMPPMSVPGFVNIHRPGCSKLGENSKMKTGIKHFGAHCKTKFGVPAFKS